ncbi:WD and tetratricopeptide repeats protein 1 [Aplysia californica]|uniref:WD and tetratricopeptide repeats protein 1 n=1 Tax=Aplysia californica TaxID=6500 RepID=A0ABM1VSF9_APLCA|nr:WD and tetratricopeptide repeats protein 1 [Aplysia californica]XP_035825351.1 WD and tetratricopeptide repeats protein 1 [Aplysia californica]
MLSLKRKIERELRDDVQVRFQRAEQVTSELVNRLGLEKELEGHEGCVNCLEWNERGSMLASGSDDRHVILWDPFKHKTITSIRTGHQGNIFSVKFLPHSNDSLIVTGAADHRINVHDLNRKETTHVFTYHLGRVKRIATAPNIPYIFWSAAEDGTIMQFDLRCSSTSTTAPNNVLVNLNAHMGHNTEAKCLAINPLRPEMLAVGANDPYVRVYDRRMLNCSNMKIPVDSVSRYPWDHSRLEDMEGESYDLPAGSAQYYIAGHLPQKQQDNKRRYRSLASTYLTFGPDGSELLVNLGGEQIYLFDINNKIRPHHFDLSLLSSNGFVKEATAPTNGFNMHVNGTNGVCKTMCSSSSSSSSLPASSSSHSSHTSSSSIPPSLSSSSSSSSRHCDRSDNPHDLPNKRHKGESKQLSPLVESLKRHANDLFEQKEYKQAIDVYNQAIARCNTAAVLYGNRAAAYLRRKWDGDLYAALRDCYQALTLDPYHMKAHYRLARCLHELCWSQEAFDCLVHFKHRFPDHAKSHSCEALEREIKAAIFSQVQDAEESSEGRGEDSMRHSSPRLESESEKDLQKNACDYSLRFCGHCNTTTDIKEANFFGSNGQYIVAGSDDGSFFIWDKKTTNIMRVLRGDESIVNCLQPHPCSCLLATSGIDHVVRLWSPRPEDGSENDREVNNSDDAALANQKRMNADPVEVMLMNMGYRFTGFLDMDEEEGGQGDGAANCRTT